MKLDILPFKKIWCVNILIVKAQKLMCQYIIKSTNSQKNFVFSYSIDRFSKNNYMILLSLCYYFFLWVFFEKEVFSKSVLS